MLRLKCCKALTQWSNQFVDPQKNRKATSSSDNTDFSFLLPCSTSVYQCIIRHIIGYMCVCHIYTMSVSSVEILIICVSIKKEESSIVTVCVYCSEQKKKKVPQSIPSSSATQPLFVFGREAAAYTRVTLIFYTSSFRHVWYQAYMRNARSCLRDPYLLYLQKA